MTETKDSRLTILVLIVAAVAIRYAAPLLSPLAVAVLLTFLLRPVVRWLTRRRIPEGVAAGVVVFGTLGVAIALTVQLKDPASRWLRDAPNTFHQVEGKLRRIAAPFIGSQPPAPASEPAGDSTAQRPTPSSTTPAPSTGFSAPSGDLLAAIFGSTADAGGALITMVFLTYFLLASGELWRGKIRDLVASGRQQQRVMETIEEIETHMSRYLLVTLGIGILKGVATWALLLAVGLPNPVLWGAVAGILNVIPYIGAIVTLVLIAAAALVSLESTDRVLIATGGFTAIMLIEGNLVTPVVLGHRLPLNAVAVFVSLVFWGWAWGVTGAVIAVPVTVMIQVICSHVPSWRRVATVLDQ